MGEVGHLAELGRIDEDRGDDAVVTFACRAHQREVALVQRAHGGDQADGVAAGAEHRDGGADFRDGSADLQRSTSCS